ncbi:hypothetical protein HYW73_01705 [Candidatus Nomurabacteria bacterium]|nr:hypothetical protein [Candidatus Nomurabacteria bacterium]
MKNNIKEIIITFCLIIVAVLLLNPFKFWMPDIMVMGILAVALVIFGIFASFVLREKVFDERDGVHRTLAGRNAFLAGAFTLILGIVIEGYSHSVDAWLVVALIIMVTVKISTRIWSDSHR